MKRNFKLFFLLITLILMFIVWIIWENTTLGVTQYKITNNKLPLSFDGYKIAVVSDLHNAEFGKNNIKLIDMIKKEIPDCIALTGDLVDSNKTDMDVAENLIKNLVKIAPVYYVTGNHEAWIGKQYQELEQRLLNSSIVILHDEIIQLTKNNDTIQIIGLDDPDFTDRDSFIQESMLETKLKNMNISDNYCILLSHRPETFNAYVSNNIDLVLSGHAHGGQFRLPFIGGIVAPNQGLFPKYDSGIYSKKNTTMIVSRGIGNSIIPVRFNNRPELVIVTLTCIK